MKPREGQSVCEHNDPSPMTCKKCREPSKSVEDKVFDFLMEDAGNYCDCRDEKPEYTCRKHTMTSMAHQLAAAKRDTDELMAALSLAMGALTAAQNPSDVSPEGIKRVLSAVTETRDRIFNKRQSAMGEEKK